MKTAQKTRKAPKASKPPGLFGSGKMQPATKKWLIELGKTSLKIGLLGLLFCAFYVAVWSGGAAPVPVSGTVSYRGKPLANVNVVCIGKGSAAATGTTDANGKFAYLTSRIPRDGALPGVYSVGIAPVTEAAATALYDLPSRPPYPTRYLSADTSLLTITVSPAGVNHFELELKD